MTISTGKVTLLAGTGVTGFSGDYGPATAATMEYPRGIDLDASGKTCNLFFTLLYRNLIYKFRIRQRLR